MDLELREYKPGDIGWIISKHGKIYTEEFGFDPVFEVDIANKFVQILKHGDPTFDMIWLAIVNGKRAGSIAVSKRSDRTAFINFVLVLREFRGMGISRELFETMMNHCRAHRILKLELETYSCLVSARKLYKKLGFEIVTQENLQEIYGLTMDREFWEMKMELNNF